MKINLSNLAEATEQQVFDQVAKHLLQQGERSCEGAVCKYKLGARSCAAGCLIDASEYSMDLEGQTWYALIQHEMVPSNHAALIDKLQKVHDSSWPRDWPEKLTLLAGSRGLNTEVLCESH